MSLPEASDQKEQVLHCQTREIISFIIDFMTKEAEQGVTIPLTKIQERVAAATKISQTTLKRIMREKREIIEGRSTAFSSPHQKRPRRSWKTGLSLEEREHIRSIIYNIYLTEKRKASLPVIFKKIQDAGISFEGGLTSLRSIILNLGFRWNNKLGWSTHSASDDLCSTADTGESDSEGALSDLDELDTD